MKPPDQPDPFGTDPGLLHRTTDPHTSTIAAHGVDTTKLEKLVFELIKQYGSKGCIGDDLIGSFPTRPQSSITPRFIALERKKWIVRGPDVRKSRYNRPQLVMRAKEFENDRPRIPSLDSISCESDLEPNDRAPSGLWSEEEEFNHRDD